MGPGPTAVCDALSCRVSLMWLISLPRQRFICGLAGGVESMQSPPTHTYTNTHRDSGVETDVMNGQAVICSHLAAPRSLSFSISFPLRYISPPLAGV